MACSLFAARRFARVALAPAAVRAAHPATLPLATRRTLFATPQFNATPANPSAEQITTEKKSGVVPAKRGRPPKDKIANPSQQKQPKEKKLTPLMPPKRAPGPYFLFYASFLKSEPRTGSLQDFQELSKQAAEIWKGYSMAEKQPYYDENEARKAQAKIERDEFFRKTSVSDLKQLNAIRKAQGKTKFRSTNKPSIPVTPFISFSNEFRDSPDGQAIINETSPDKKYVVRAVLAAAERWRSMSQEEKAPYFEKYRKAKEELKAEHTKS